MTAEKAMVKIISTILLLFLQSAHAVANGGPVAWTGVTPIGAVGLVQTNDIKLNSENLK